MKRLALLAVLVVAGCQPPPGSTGTAPKQNGVVAFTQADLTNAITMAQAAGPQGVEIVSCFTFLQSQLSALQTQTTAPTGGTVGAASAFVFADLALGNVANATSSGSQAAFEIACGPLAIHMINQGLTLQQQVASLASLLVK